MISTCGMRRRPAGKGFASVEFDPAALRLLVEMMVGTGAHQPVG